MNWMDVHFGSIGYAADFYIPQSGVASSGDGKNTKKQVGDEQFRVRDKNWEPRVVKTKKFDFPRLQKFYDWDHFLDWVDWRGNESRRASHDTRTRWQTYTKTKDFQSAMNLARYGWTDGLKEIEKLKDQTSDLEPVRKSYDIDTNYNIAGGSIHIGRFLSNAPDCMRSMQFSKQHTLPTRTVKIIVATYCDSKTESETIIKNGYKIYQFIEMLEIQNIRTEIILVSWANKLSMYNEQDYDMYESYIKLKNIEDTFYPEKLLFALAHPAMMQRLILSERERNPYNIRQKFGFYTRGGYGHAIESWMPSSDIATGAMVLKSTSLPEISVLLDQARKLTKER